MSVRVNLLPGDVRARGEATRARAGAAVLGLLLLAVLGLLTFMQRGSISDAEDRLAAVEAANTQLEAEIVALQPFADLETRASESIETVSTALGDQKSVATVLQDLSAVMPPGAQLDTVAVTFSPDPLAPAAGGTRLVHGTLLATGQVLDGIAPGVERLAIDLGRVAAFDNVFVTTATADEEGVIAFTIELEFGPEVFTGRFVDPADAPPGAPTPTPTTPPATDEEAGE